MYDEENGLPTTEMAMLKNIDGKMQFLTMAGIFEFNKDESIFEPSELIGQVSADTTVGAWDIFNYKDGYIISRYDNSSQKYWVEYAKKNAQGEYIRENTPEFDWLPKNVNLNYIYVDNEGNLWICIDIDLYCYKPEMIDKANPYYKESFNTHVRQIVANDTIVLFGGAFVSENGGIAISQPKNQIIEIPYSENSLTFRYSSTFYDSEDETEYSTMIEGDDKKWSTWKKNTEYSRMHLGEGNYTFKVKARNIYGVESPVTTFSFVIKPPFYRTIVAYLLYVILLVVLVYGIVKWNTHRLIEEKKNWNRRLLKQPKKSEDKTFSLSNRKTKLRNRKTRSSRVSTTHAVSSAPC